MIKATAELLRQHRSGERIEYCNPLIDVVSQFGSREDSEALLDIFIQTQHHELLEPVSRYGDSEIARKLFEASISEGKLKEDYPSETLLALSYLGHPELESILMGYFASIHEVDMDWDFHRAVCLGLLNYPCTGYEDLILRQIEQCLDKSLFPEFIPALAIKTNDPDIAGRIYHHGNTLASSDANAGIVLGLALYGDKHTDLFRSIIWNERWEAGETGTGTAWYTTMGMSYLKITIKELYQDILADVEAGIDERVIKDKLWVMHGLLHMKLSGWGSPMYWIRCIEPLGESFTSIYRELFKWRNPDRDDSIVGISKACDPLELLESMFNELKPVFELKMEHEIESIYSQPAV